VREPGVWESGSEAVREPGVWESGSEAVREPGVWESGSEAMRHSREPSTASDATWRTAEAAPWDTSSDMLPAAEDACLWDRATVSPWERATVSPWDLGADPAPWAELGQDQSETSMDPAAEAGLWDASGEQLPVETPLWSTSSQAPLGPSVWNVNTQDVEHFDFNGEIMPNILGLDVTKNPPWDCDGEKMHQNPPWDCGGEEEMHEKAPWDCGERKRTADVMLWELTEEGSERDRPADGGVLWEVRDLSQGEPTLDASIWQPRTGVKRGRSVEKSVSWELGCAESDRGCDKNVWRADCEKQVEKDGWDTAAPLDKTGDSTPWSRGAFYVCDTVDETLGESRGCDLRKCFDDAWETPSGGAADDGVDKNLWVARDEKTIDKRLWDSLRDVLPQLDQSPAMEEGVWEPRASVGDGETADTKARAPDQWSSDWASAVLGEQTWRGAAWGDEEMHDLLRQLGDGALGREEHTADLGWEFIDENNVKNKIDNAPTCGRCAPWWASRNLVTRQ